MPILLASELIAAALKTYLVSLFKWVKVPLAVKNNLSYHSAFSAGGVLRCSMCSAIRAIFLHGAAVYPPCFLSQKRPGSTYVEMNRPFSLSEKVRMRGLHTLLPYFLYSSPQPSPAGEGAF